ncbi:MAG: hypothetical protein AB7O67_00900 [Vicinamibacterales bacterium]
MRIHQAQVRLQKRFSGRLGFLVGYTLGSAKTIANNGTPSDNYDLMADWGPTSNDVRHRFVGNVIYELPYQIQVGGIVTANSAPPYNITLGTDANRDAVNNDRPAGEGFNSGRGDTYFQTDLRLSKKVTFGRFSGEILWEMFNVFNTVNFNNYQGNQRSAPGVTSTGIPTGFGQPGQAFDAFQGQLGFKLIFLDGSASRRCFTEVPHGGAARRCRTEVPHGGASRGVLHEGAGRQSGTLVPLRTVLAHYPSAPSCRTSVLHLRPAPPCCTSVLHLRAAPSCGTFVQHLRPQVI